MATARRAFPNLPQGRRLLAVVFGTASENARANETQKLLNWGYTAYDGVQLFGADQPVAQARVWKGAHSEVGLGRHQPITVAVPAGKARELTTQVERTDPLIAPIVRDQQVGTLRVQLGGQTLSTLPLQALQDDPQAGFFRRLWDSLLLLFHGSGKKST